MRRIVLTLLAAALFAAGCTPTAPPPAVTPQGDDRFLIDPRTGAAPLDPRINRKFEAAWRFALAGNEAQARERLYAIRKLDPNLPQSSLVEAALDIRAGRLDDARVRLETLDSPVARAYEAEIALREGQTRRALDLYRAIATVVPTASERIAQIENTLFEQLLTAAQAASDADAISLLREALTFRPAAIEPRILLSSRLVMQRRFDDARREIDPLLNSGEVDRTEVQELLAEIDVGRGRYQEAIVRYDRLSRRTKDPRHAQRLNEIKEEWSMANMPAHHRAALESPAITRADLAVLLYWTVPSIRFARNLGSPPIAVDVEDVAGREEMIRAIAIGFLDVDPVTRRVNPFRIITADRLSRHLARVLQLRGAACARGVSLDKVLPACSVTDPLATFAPDATVPGREAEKMLAQVAKHL